jgi:hypothetical protein
MSKIHYPVFLCKPIKGNQVMLWQFWCPWCRVHHVHGAGPGHRIPHCDPSHDPDPFPDGYMLKLDPRFKRRAEKSSSHG